MTTEYMRLQAAAMTEKDLQAQVIHVAETFGWKVFHPYDSRKSVPGYPDLTMVRPGRLVFAELKSEHGKHTIAQLQWLTALAEVTGNSRPVETYTWRPHDLMSGSIVQVLR